MLSQWRDMSESCQWLFFLRLKEGFEELGDLLGAVCGLCVTNGALVRT